MKTKTTHTPGPWEVRDLTPAFPDCLDITHNGITLATIKREGIFSEDENARLIAAAPDLLEAAHDARKRLARCLKLSDDVRDKDNIKAHIDELDAAITKAEGREAA